VRGRNYTNPWRSAELRVTPKWVFTRHDSQGYPIHAPQILLGDEIRIAEVRFFAILRRGNMDVPVALVSLFSKHDPTLYRLSVNTLWSCEYQGDSALEFIDIKCIQSVVAMIPHAPAIEGQVTRDRFFLVEKPGLDVAIMAGAMEHVNTDDTDTNPELEMVLGM
jgi:hypothetical protein